MVEVKPASTIDAPFFRTSFSSRYGRSRSLSSVNCFPAMTVGDCLTLTSSGAARPAWPSLSAASRVIWGRPAIGLRR